MSTNRIDDSCYFLVLDFLLDCFYCLLIIALYKHNVALNLQPDKIVRWKNRRLHTEFSLFHRARKNLPPITLLNWLCSAEALSLLQQQQHLLRIWHWMCYELWQKLFFLFYALQYSHGKLGRNSNDICVNESELITSFSLWCVAVLHDWRKCWSFLFNPVVPGGINWSGFWWVPFFHSKCTLVEFTFESKTLKFAKKEEIHFSKTNAMQFMTFFSIIFIWYSLHSQIYMYLFIHLFFCCCFFLSLTKRLKE